MTSRAAPDIPTLGQLLKHAHHLSYRFTSRSSRTGRFPRRNEEYGRVQQVMAEHDETEAEENDGSGTKRLVVEGSKV